VEAVLDLLARREIVVGLALFGAVLATVGAYARGRAQGARKSWAERLVYAGYGLTAASILLFIVAGFRT
jgi:hypothetical protein